MTILRSTSGIWVGKLSRAERAYPSLFQVLEVRRKSGDVPLKVVSVFGVYQLPGGLLIKEISLPYETVLPKIGRWSRARGKIVSVFFSV